METTEVGRGAEHTQQQLRLEFECGSTLRYSDRPVGSLGRTVGKAQILWGAARGQRSSPLDREAITARFDEATARARAAAALTPATAAR